MRILLFCLLFVSLSLGCTGHELEIPSIVPPASEDKPEKPEERPETPEEPTTPEEEGSVIVVKSAEEVANLGTVKAGTQIVWSKGEYANQIVVLKAQGTKDNPVIIKAESYGETIFTGASRIQIKGEYVVVSGLWWRNPEAVKSKAIITLDRGSRGCVVEQCAITGDKTTRKPDIDAKWVSLYGSEHRVESCSFLDKRNMGTLLVVWLEKDGDAPRHRIIRNHFTRPVTLFDEEGNMINGQETIRIGDSSSSMQDAMCTVEGNYFYECHGEQAEIISNKSCSNIYRGNLFERSMGSLTLRHGNRCWVIGNFFLGGGVGNTGGVRIIGDDHTVENNYMQDLQGTGYKSAITLVRGQKDPALSGYWEAKRAMVHSNIIVNCRYGINVNYGSSSQVMPVVECKIEKNIVSLNNPSHYSVNYVEEPEPDVEWSDNTIYGGKQKGISLPTVDTPPTIPDISASITNVRRRAGVSW